MSFLFAKNGGMLIMQSKNQKKKQKRNKKEPVLTHRDIEALMGIHQDIYERHDHALRRKGR